jgi:hypothetical protein
MVRLMAKVVNEPPPIFEKIAEKFPVVRTNRAVIFTYGDTIYNPGGNYIDDELMLHEETHIRQQAMMNGGKDAWWDKYLEDPQFRTDQELEAYQAQFNATRTRYGRPVWRRELKRLARDLSSPIYGNILSYDEAAKLIKEGVEL